LPVGTQRLKDTVVAHLGTLGPLKQRGSGEIDVKME
jgi:hypothetical protein